ncbi:MAG: cation transporter [Ignavibacteriaceae bacterium]|nr:MAG: cation transporter [Ignavibacteriaceae bacterium]
MGHDHNHVHGHGHHHGHHHHPAEGDSTAGIKSAFWLNFFFAIIEIAGGILTNSYAILSDAVHDLGDTAAIGMSFILEKVSHKKRDSNFSYGYKRISLLAGLLSTIILLMGSLFIIYGAVMRLIDPGEVNSAGMFLIAMLGVAVNGMAFFRLKGDEKANVKAVRLHLLEDVLGWVAVIIGSVIIYFTGFTWIDPLLSLGISVFILYNAVLNLSSFSRIFLQGMPSGLVEDDLKKELAAIPGVESLHDLHIWSMDGTYNIMSVHLVVKEELGRETVSRIRGEAREVSRKFSIVHDTIEIGYCSDDCEFVDC